MDLITYWDNIQFTPLYKEKNLWIHGATVNSGQTVQLRVVSRNKATHLKDMNWVLIYGTPQKEKERVQYFSAPLNIEKVLSIHNETLTERLYVHKWEPYTITVQLDPNVINMHVPEDKCILAAIVSSPTFTIKKLSVKNEY